MLHQKKCPLYRRHCFSKKSIECYVHISSEIYFHIVFKSILYLFARNYHAYYYHARNQMYQYGVLIYYIRTKILYIQHTVPYKSPLVENCFYIVSCKFMFIQVLVHVDDFFACHLKVAFKSTGCSRRDILVVSSTYSRIFQRKKLKTPIDWSDDI